MAIRNNFKHTFYASYGGYFVQAIINNFLPLLFLTFQRDFSLPYDKISLLIVINFGFQLVVDYLAAYFIDKIGYKKCTIAAHLLAAAGLCSLSVLPYIMSPFIGIVISIVIYATGSGLIEVIISPLVDACPSDNKEGAMSLLHSFYCWGHMCVVLLSTLFFALFSVENWRILSVIWALVPLANGIYFCYVPFPDILGESKSMSVKELFKTRLFYVFALVMLCSGASEQAMSQWASAFAESGLQVSKTMGDLLGPCMFAFLMGSARVLYSKISEKYSLVSVMVASGALCVVSYLVASLSPNPLVSLIGCGVCGFSVGVMWPGTFSLAALRMPEGGTALFAMLALFGDSGCALGPAVVGRGITLFDGDFSKGMLLALVFPLLLIIGVMKTSPVKGGKSR
ncbi:MAG: MFS transporter [Clostridia bacterium]|nr:MFS transporter [Clostridia bacterium]MBQ1967931.1 MFS transporter [Clostridia bacterium]MBQ5905456.1 MFS transporter [Clostridia bacterium]